MKVAILSPTEREEVDRLQIRLEERMGEGVVIDSREDPRLAIQRGKVRSGNVDLSSLKGIYVADLGLRSPFARDSEGNALARESRAARAASHRHLCAWNTVLHVLARQMPVVNPPATHDLHTLKPWEIFATERWGVALPRSVATSDPQVLVDLPAREHGWVQKRMVGGYAHTERFHPPTDLVAARDMLAGGPLLVQERIVGTNVRVYVVAGKVEAAGEIIPVAGDEVDSRRGDVRIRRITVPDEVAGIAIQVARNWGMAFTAADFMRDVAGRYFLLECNSAPFFVHFERMTGCNIAGPLADLLLQRARTI